MPKSARNQGVVPGYTWAQACRDIVVASINKGQFPWIIFGLLGLVAVFRMPAEVLGQITKEVVQDFHTLHVLGWIFAVLLLVAWVWHAHRQASFYEAEIGRLAEERNRYQSDALGDLMESSRAEK